MCQFGAISLCVPALVAFIYRESDWRYYLLTAAFALVLSFIVAMANRGQTTSAKLTRREGFLAVVLSWLTVVGLGAIPFWISGAIPSLADAVFESASGYSTTGATILRDIEALSHAHLFQRSLAHWIGGMGIIVLTDAILPELAVGGMQLFTAESSGIGTDKLSPRIVSTSRRLWQVYVGLTVVLVVLLLLGGMNVFDAVTHAFGTLATGGFSTKNASVGAFDSVYIESVITFFMLASGMSFALHYRLLVRRQPGPLLRSEEVRLYLAVFLLFTTGITLNLLYRGTYGSIAESVRYAVFQTASILTTTGYGTANFDLWPDLSRYLLVLLMFLGACAGSTAGGVKVIRLLVVIKDGHVELRKLLFPELVRPVTINGRAVQPETIQAILGFFILYITTTVAATAFVLATGVDLVTGVTAVVSAMNSIGPGLGLVGPSQNYAFLPDACKWILAACMIVGRLEIYTVLVIFTVPFWKR
jgi:trk system potassium uptake protein TrkH